MFNWLTRKPQISSAPEAPSSDLGQLDATLPIAHAPTQHLTTAADTPSSRRKALRLEQRELLYAVVRECMTKSGILSSSYKFKVLSLDSRGKEYLVMVDLPPSQMSHPHRLMDIEGLIARHAKALHDILVTAVYWRVNEQVRGQTSPDDQVNPVVEVAEHAPIPVSREEHLEAFRRSFAANEVSQTATAAIVEVASTVGDLTVDFADTEIEEPHSPISGTQYGDLR
jgi:hypothetical protein